jgi:hypothetical protein
MLMKEVKTSPATVAPPATVSGAMQQVKKAKTRRGKGGLKRKMTPEERAARKRHKRNKKNKEKKKKAKAEANARRAAGVEPLASSTGSLTKNPVTSGAPAPMITDTVSRVVPAAAEVVTAKPARSKCTTAQPSWRPQTEMQKLRAAAESAVGTNGRSTNSNKKKKKKKKMRWRDRIQVYLQQLPYDATTVQVQEWLEAGGVAFSPGCKVDVTTKRRPRTDAAKKRNKKGAMNKDAPAATPMKASAGYAFVTLTTEAQLAAALALDGKPFTPMLLDDEALQVMHPSAAKQLLTSGRQRLRRSKIKRWPVRVSKVLTKKELKLQNAEKAKRAAEDAAAAAAALLSTSGEKNLETVAKSAAAALEGKAVVEGAETRSDEEVSEDVLAVLAMRNGPRGRGLRASDVDAHNRKLLAAMTRVGARAALREFDLRGAGKGNAGLDNRQSYLATILKKWKRGDGKADDLRVNKRK